MKIVGVTGLVSIKIVGVTGFQNIFSSMKIVCAIGFGGDAHNLHARLKSILN